ncbi:MAG: fimbrillin family protein [Bacteroidia bacterium]|nr:fimbrillin family protein [Bacteroidia bacterium]
MNVRRLYIITAAAAVLFSGCVRVVIDRPDPEGPETTGDVIDFGISVTPGTKGMINENDFNKAGNQLHVYDFLSYNANEVKYIDNTITATTVESAIKWQFPDNKEYEWTRTGAHKFFGWFAFDANSDLEPSSIFGEDPAMDDTEKILTIPSTGMLTMNFSTPQFDFLYSDIIKRTMDGQTSSHLPVDLEMNHLFSAISIGAENFLKGDITINSVTIQGLYNTQKADVDFSGDETAITYTKSETRGKFITTPNVTLKQDETLANILTSDSEHTTPFLIWPQEADDLVPNAEYYVNESGECVTGGDNNPLIIITYSIGSGADAFQCTIPLPIPAGAWQAGVHNHISIAFADKVISAKVVVLPWDYTETDIDFEEGTLSIHDGNELSVQDANCYKDLVNKKIYLTNTLPIKCNFWLDTPRGSTWMVTKLCDIDAFEIIDGSGTIDGSQAEFQIRPMVSGDIARDYILKLHFSVRLPDGRSVDADNPVLGTNKEYDYSFIIQKK